MYEELISKLQKNNRMSGWTHIDRLIDEAIEAIKALQQKNEQLRAQVTDMQGKVKYLWRLLDDIDTAGDMAKSDDKAYRSIVESIHPKRATVAESDGYEIFIKDDAYIDYHNPADVEALKKVREYINIYNDTGIVDWIDKALAEIDKVLGGGEK